ncbi:MULTISPECIES: hypothetical protein [unclassified Pseudomonas]|nr:MULTISPECIES: hypothetical protein [unclassified Pseudomonas]WPN55977.1 hypothetical protein QMK51_17650 [Pseudomonas sp. P9_31]
MAALGHNWIPSIRCECRTMKNLKIATFNVMRGDRSTDYTA